MMISVIKELYLQGLVQVLLPSRLRCDSAVASTRLFIDFLDLFLFLDFLCTTLDLCHTVHTATHHRWVVGNGFILSHVFLMN